MGVRRHRRHRLSAALALLLFFASALGSGLVRIVQEVEAAKLIGPSNTEHWARAVPTRRRLIGPGSSPPTCRLRCGRCFPCRPVQVAIQPGQSIPLEYYPEAWRCKCGNKLFMP